MKKRVLVLNLILMSFIMLVSVGCVSGLLDTSGFVVLNDGNVPSCGYILNNPSYIYELNPDPALNHPDVPNALNEDTIAAPSDYYGIKNNKPCLIITGSDIELDLNGIDIMDIRSYDIDTGNFISEPQANAILISDASDVKIYNSVPEMNAGLTEILDATTEIKGFVNGIYIEASSNILLGNITVKENIRGISFLDTSFNELTNIIAIDNDDYGIYFLSSSNNILNNIQANSNDASIWATSGDGIHFSSSSNNLISDSEAKDNENNGIFIEKGSNNKFIDCDFGDNSGDDVSLEDESKNNTFLSCGYPDFSESIDDTSELIRKWYLDTYINDQPSGADTYEAKIVIKDNTEEIESSSLTSASGYVRQEIIQYINDGVDSDGDSDDKDTHNPHTMEISKEGYVDLGNMIRIIENGIDVTDSYTGSFNMVEDLLYDITFDKDLRDNFITLNIDSPKPNPTSDDPRISYNSEYISLYNTDFVFFNITSNEDLYTCELNINDLVSDTLMVLSSGDESMGIDNYNPKMATELVEDISDGFYEADFSCSSSGVNVNRITDPGAYKVKFSVQSPPVLSIDFPEAGRTYKKNSLDFEISANEDLSECEVEVFNSSDDLIIFAEEEGGVDVDSILVNRSSSMPDGSYYANFTCWDIAGNENNKSVSFSISAELGIFIDSPEPSNEKIYTTNAIEFKVSSNEDLSWCKSSIDHYSTNYTMVSIDEGTFNYTNSSVPEGSYVARFWCETEDSVERNVSLVFKISKSPDFIVNSPLDGMKSSETTIYFNVSSDPDTIPVLDFSSCIYSFDGFTVDYPMVIYADGKEAGGYTVFNNDDTYDVSFWCNYTNGKSVTIEDINFTIDRGSIGTPNNLKALADTTSKINLTWNDNAGNEVGFEVERKVAGGNYSVIANLSADTKAYGSIGLSENTTYFYRVRAFNSSNLASNYSDYSNEANATTLVTVVSDDDGDEGVSGCDSNSDCDAGDECVDGECVEEDGTQQQSQQQGSEGQQGVGEEAGVGLFDDNEKMLFYVQVGIGALVIIVLLVLVFVKFVKKKSAGPRQVPSAPASQPRAPASPR